MPPQPSPADSRGRSPWDGCPHPSFDRDTLIPLPYRDDPPIAAPKPAGLAQHPEDYPWSSARAHLTGANDPLVKGSPLPKMVGNWREFLTLTDEEELNLLKRHERSGRPLGGAAFVHRVETELARILRPQKRGPKPKAE